MQTGWIYHPTSPLWTEGFRGGTASHGMQWYRNWTSFARPRWRGVEKGSQHRPWCAAGYTGFFQKFVPFSYKTVSHLFAILEAIFLEQWLEFKRTFRPLCWECKRWLLLPRLHRPASLDSNVFSSVKKGHELLKHPVVARGFWKRQRSAFFDGRDCYPNADS